MGYDQAADALPYIVWAKQKSSPIELTNYYSENKDTLRPLLYKHGAVLFRGFEIVDHAWFARVAASMTGPLLDYRGGVARRRQLGNNIYNSTEMPTDRTLALHNEKSYSTRHPDLVLFCCVTPAVTGGATPLADGRRAWQRLGKKLKDELRTRPITFIQNLHSGIGAGKSWITAYETGDRVEIEDFLRSIGAHFLWRKDDSLHVEETVGPVKVHPVTAAEALFCPVDTWYRCASEFGGGREAACRASEEYGQYCRFHDGDEIEPWMVAEIKSAIADETREFQWRRGDLLLIDNRIVLHGRGSFTGDRLVLVAMGNDMA